MRRLPIGWAIFETDGLEPEMSKAVRLSAAIPVTNVLSRDASQAAKHNELVPIAIFSGLGLLISLVAVICGVQGAWF
jgi:hypothetical protein